MKMLMLMRTWPYRALRVDLGGTSIHSYLEIYIYGWIYIYIYIQVHMRTFAYAYISVHICIYMRV